MSRRVPPKRPTAARPFLLAGVVVAAFIALGWTLSMGSAPAPAPEPVAVSQAIDPAHTDHHSVTDGRTVVVARLGEQVPGISGETGPLMTNLVSGAYPDGATVATVRTDENCNPDQNGVSHCLNELDFGDTQIVVQHHHAMAKTPCLTPGEQVNVITVEQFEAQA
jgi:hypothetical protein